MFWFAKNVEKLKKLRLNSLTFLQKYDIIFIENGVSPRGKATDAHNKYIVSAILTMRSI